MGEIGNHLGGLSSSGVDYVNSTNYAADSLEACRTTQQHEHEHFTPKNGRDLIGIATSPR